MQYYTYHYDKTYQCLVKATPEGKEISRLSVPFCDLERICVILYAASADKLFLKGEEE